MPAAPGAVAELELDEEGEAGSEAGKEQKKRNLKESICRKRLQRGSGSGSGSGVERLTLSASGLEAPPRPGSPGCPGSCRVYGVC